MENNRPTPHSQAVALRRLLDHIAGAEPSYYQALAREFANIPLNDLCQAFREKVPFTAKPDLVADRSRHAPRGSFLTEPFSRYNRFCQTSGTSTGQPLAWYDTPESWQVLLDCWKIVLTEARIQPGVDSIYFAFSFGPFLGFWTAFEAATAMGILGIPGGGLSSTARLAAMDRYQPTVLCCTPTYAQRLGELRRELPEFQDKPTSIKTIIVAGETGGSVENTRHYIASLWDQARVFDHHGLTEVGPVTYEHPQQPGILRVMEDFYLAEVIDPETAREVADGEEGELVLTTLQRLACPLLRYRTGDLVRKRIINEGLHLEGGILGRADDMVVVRGVNLYPSAIENIIRSFPEIGEFKVTLRHTRGMDECAVEIETSTSAPEDTTMRLETKLRDTFLLRIPVEKRPEGTFPKPEFKAKRWFRATQLE